MGSSAGRDETDALARLNALPDAKAEAGLLACCGARAWARRMSAARPFATLTDMLETADRIWRALDRTDWLEAFAAHPRIGAHAEAGGAVGRASRWSAQEQSGTHDASRNTMDALAEANRAYEARFGHFFIVSASAKGAGEMLAIVNARMANHRDEELRVAAEEQRKITRLRLLKLLGSESRTPPLDKLGAP